MRRNQLILDDGRFIEDIPVTKKGNVSWDTLPQAMHFLCSGNILASSLLVMAESMPTANHVVTDDKAMLESFLP